LPKVATSKKTRQGLKHIDIDDEDLAAQRCNEQENPTGIETSEMAMLKDVTTPLQRARKPDRD